MINTIINNYQIQEKIGEGGMGTVYRGVDLTLHRPVAIKILHPHLLSDQSIIERFCSEARTLANLNHQNLATLYNFVTYEETFCMVMEYVEGRTLAEIIQAEEKLSVDTALNYVQQILRGLNHAHQQGIIHRDVKPSNIIVTNDHEVKVMDFGIARIIGSQRFTRTGTMIGTLQYMAPEQIKGEEGGVEADLYAVSTVLYEMLAGELPHADATEYGMIQKKVSEKPRNLHQMAPFVSMALSQTIMRALEINPEKRYHSANNFIAALNQDTIPVGDENKKVNFNLQGISLSGKKHFKWMVMASAIILSIIGFKEVRSNQIPTGQEENHSLVWSPNPEIPEANKPLIVPAANKEAPVPGGSLPIAVNIDSLFEMAITLYDQDQWLQPEHKNALILCKEILKVKEAHEGASEMIQKMADHFEELGDSLRTDSLFDQASEAYENALSCQWSRRVNDKKKQINKQKSIQIRLPKTDAKPTFIKAAKTLDKKKTPAAIKVEEKTNEKASDEEASQQSTEVKEDNSSEKQNQTQEEKVAESGQSKTVSGSNEKTESKEAEHVYVSSGKEIKLALDESISSASHKSGDLVSFTVTADLVVRGKTIIRQGQKARGQITQTKSLLEGNKSVLEVQILSVKAVTGKKIEFKANTFRIIGKRNQEAEILKGQIFEVRTDHDYTLKI